MAWPRQPPHIRNLLRPFKGSVETFLERPLEDRKFILRSVFSWLDHLFEPILAPIDYRLRTELLTKRQILNLEERIMRFVISAVVQRDFTQINLPDSDDWFTYALIRGDE